MPEVESFGVGEGTDSGIVVVDLEVVDFGCLREICFPFRGDCVLNVEAIECFNNFLYVRRERLLLGGRCLSWRFCGV